MHYDSNWNLEPPANFQGLREDLPLDVYIRNLPHWRQKGATYFVTFRLADSIPLECTALLQRIRADWLARNPMPHSPGAVEQLGRVLFERVEYWLDQGSGSCLLQDSENSKIVDDAIRYFHKELYELGASVVMANHVHCILRPFLTTRLELEDLLGRCKSFTANKINARNGLSGSIWQQESFDRIVRDSEHLWRCLQYIGKNPTKAGRSADSCRLWLNPEWEQSGWTFVS